jgi:hypothetical protein
MMPWGFGGWVTIVAGVTLGKSVNSSECGSDFVEFDTDGKTELALSSPKALPNLYVPPENKHDEAGNEVQEVQH